MPALSPSSLAAACRTIYVQAGEAEMLPPLIRDAAEAAPIARRLEADGSDFRLALTVAYDEPARMPRGRLDRTPLRFEMECVAGPDDEPVELSDAQRFEIIRAFVLGVREPLAIDAPADGTDWRVGLHIAPRFSLWADEPVRLDEGLSTGEIAERLAARLLPGTHALFASPAQALAVWKSRLREELYAEPRLAAHEIWPADRQQPAPLPAFQPACAQPSDIAAPRGSRRQAIAAALALLGLAALASAMASRGVTGKAAFAPEPQQVSAAALPAPAQVADRSTDAPAPRPVAPPDRTPWSAPEADMRLALLAPVVADAARVLSPVSTAEAAPVRIATAPLPVPRPRDLTATGSSRPDPAQLAISGKTKPRATAKQGSRPAALAGVDRAMRKLVKSVAQRLPRIKMTALNSPHAAGPRRP